MKTINIALSILAAAATLTSCSDYSDEIPANINRTPAKASFHISIPTESGTRADYEVSGADYTLEWTVFEITDNGAPKIFTTGTKPIESLSAIQDIELQLVNNTQYKITFCAYDDKHRSFAYYDNGKVKVNYAAAASIQIGDDLFTGSSASFRATGEDHTESVRLSRPFAQLNWGSADLESSTVSPYLSGTKASVTVEATLYQTLDLFSGEFSDPLSGFTFSEFDCSKLSEANHGIKMYEKDYRLLASNLMLIGSGTATANCKMTFTGNVEVEAQATNAPLTSNYRTNIYGSLISNSADISLSISEFFEDGINVTKFD